MYKKLQSFRIKLIIAALCLAQFGAIAQDLATLGNSGNADPLQVQKDKMRRLTDILSELEATYQVRFAFNNELAENKMVNSSQIVEGDLDQTLTNLLKPLQLKFKKSEVKNFYLIVPKEDKVKKLDRNPVMKSKNSANLRDDRFLATKIQSIYSKLEKTDIIVKGKVTSQEDASPLPGVNVMVKGTTAGTTTDSNGEYAINAPEDGVLVFSFIGFTTEEVAISNRSVIDVSLTADIKQLSEVVVVGYGTQKKKDITGSVSSVLTDEIKDFTVGRVDQALVGKVAGVQIKQNTGEPGAAPQILVRGYNSIDKDSSPLFVIDGHPIDNINSLNPNDIERIDILKDASATAIYGSRGTNGVILITTRKGTKGEPKINFSFYRGVQSIAKKVDMMNSKEIAQFQYDSFVQRNLDEGNDISGDPLSWRRPVPNVVVDVLNGTNTVDTDWQDEIFRSSASIQNYQLSTNGSSEFANYYLSGEYFNQEGIIENSGFERFSLRLNLESTPTKRLKVGAKLNPSFSLKQDVQTDGTGENLSKSIISNALIAQPFYPVYDEQGDFLNLYGLDGAVNNTNPVAISRLISDKEQITRITGNATLEYDIINDLRFKSLIGIDLVNFRNSYFQPKANAFTEGIPYAENNNNQNINWLATFTLDYNKTINNEHDISILLGYDIQKNKFESSSMSSDNFPNNLVKTLNAASEIDFGSTFEREWALLSYLGRINYNFKNKYYLTTSLRRDGSSRFGNENKWGWFPSGALAWRLSEEEFLKKVDFISNLKFRASFGLTGNNNIGDYLFVPTVSYNGYILGNNLVGGYAPNRIANPGLQWEQQKEFNFGGDFGFFNDRIQLNIDYFIKRNENLLLDVQIPSITGFTNAITNIGTIENRGWEFSLNTSNLKKNLIWNTNFNISFYRNKIIELGPEGDPILTGSGFSHITQIGQPVGMFYGWIVESVIMNQEQLDDAPRFNPGGSAETRVGDFRFRDINNDNIIDGQDRTIMGNPHPDFIFGMVNNFNYRNFELSISIQGVYGNQLLGAQKNLTMNTRGRRNQMAIMNNYWKSEENPGNGKIPRPNNNPTGNNRGAWNTFYLEDGSFARVNNITLAYNLGSGLLNKLGLESTRIFLSSMNPFTITKYSSYNPDVSNSTSPLTPGVDYNDYPVLRTISLGANIGF